MWFAWFWKRTLMKCQTLLDKKWCCSHPSQNLSPTKVNKTCFCWRQCSFDHCLAERPFIFEEIRCLCIFAKQTIHQKLQMWLPFPTKLTFNTWSMHGEDHPWGITGGTSFVLKIVMHLQLQCEFTLSQSLMTWCYKQKRTFLLWQVGQKGWLAPMLCARSCCKGAFLSQFVSHEEGPPLLLAVICSWIMVVVGKQSGGWAAPRKLHHHSLFQMMHPNKDEFFGHSKMKDKTHSNTS